MGSIGRGGRRGRNRFARRPESAPESASGEVYFNDLTDTVAPCERSVSELRSADTILDKKRDRTDSRRGAMRKLDAQATMQLMQVVISRAPSGD